MLSAAVALLGSALAAQEARGPAAGAPAATAAALGPRALVRVRTAAGAHFWGTLVSRSADSLVLTAGEPGRLRAVAVADVDTLWARRGAHAGAGAVIGGLALGGAAAAFCFGMSEGNALNDSVACGGAAGLAGTVIGVAVGLVVPRWRHLYP